ncbi:MAG: AI-2E family transporter, partial [Anaerolineae bacterium]|nr:AI-2E family transporter [Anaerolineae bacterium]
MSQNVTRWRGRWLPDGWWERTLSVAVALIIGLGTLWLLQLLAWPLALLIGAVAVAAALAPLIERLAQRMPRTAAVILFYLLLLGLFLLIGWLAVPRVWSSAQTAIDEGPQLVEQWQQQLNNWLPGSRLSIGGLLERFFGGSGFNNALTRSSQSLTRLVTAFVIVFFGSLYALLDGPRFHRFVLSLFAVDRRDEANEVIAEIMDAMGGFIRGELLAALIIGVLTYIGLLIIGFPYALALAVMAGLLEFIPLIGPFITAIVLVLVGLSQSLSQAAFALVLALVIQQIESNVVLPNVMRQEAKVSPLLVLLSILGGERIGGLVGALVAIPLVAGIRVLVLRVIAPAIRRWTGA